MDTITKIEKENITLLKFNKKEVLTFPEDLRKRDRNLHRALLLGNISRNKVKITFESADEKAFQVETTIWSVGKDFITLKSGIVIPKNAILKVD